MLVNMLCMRHAVLERCMSNPENYMVPLLRPARTSADVRRTMRTADRKRIARRFDLRQQSRATPKANEVATNWFGYRSLLQNQI